MATTSLSLGEHWEVYIKNEIASGRYGSASEVVRDALRAMEERGHHCIVLRKSDKAEARDLGFKVYSEEDLDKAEHFFKGKGLPVRGEAHGDLSIHIRIRVPDPLSEIERKLFQQLADSSSFNPRQV